MTNNSSQLNTSGDEVKGRLKKFTVGRIFLLLLAGLILFFLIIWGWRTWFYYQQIKAGKIISLARSYGLTLANKVTAETIQLQNLITADAPSFGSADAKITIVEFADFQCPYSKEVFTTMREFVAKNKDKVRLVFRHFPLADIHPEAVAAAEAASCANEQDKFWPMHDKLFQNQDRLLPADLKNYASQIGLDRNKFDGCLDGRKFRNQVLADYRDGFKAGVAGTPTFFINGRRAAGAIPLFEWEKIVK